MMPRWLVWTISVVAFVLVGWWVLNGAMAVSGHEIDYPDWFRQSKLYIEIVIATGILVTIAKYEGAEKIGFTGSTSYNVRLSLQWTYMFLALGTLLFWFYSYFLLGLLTSGDLSKSWLGVSNQLPNAYIHVLKSIHGGWVEETIVVGLLFFLFGRVPWRINGRAFALTGWATAICVAVRLSYQTFWGIWLVPLILIAWAMVRIYRTTGTIIPLIVGHVVWDISDLVLPTDPARLLFALVLMAVAGLLTKGLGSLSALGLQGYQRKDKNWTRFYWARWRWQVGPEERGPSATLAAPNQLRREDVGHVGLGTPDA